MNEQVQALAEALEDIDERIREAKDAMMGSDSAAIYHQAFEAKVDLLRDRQRIVEQLEELGSEDPDL
ncbi:hypothetical protein SEA_TANDEM_96 [Microbacterium phage Tandem]|nr:hypothetical protein SEA_TANDEM_96 [Microbacterium phage Tandem]QAU07426.1 hypothetical protein SEA_ALLEB_94 [Microbacterium phage Alleb]